MERTIKIISLFILFGWAFISASFSQNESFEKAIENGNFKKIEMRIKKEIKKYKYGVKFYNGPGSGLQTSFKPSLDSVVNWLLQCNGVVDATWDKCQIKLAIYPGAASIGVVFKTKKGLVEKCYKIQKGTTGQVNIFGWKLMLSKPKSKLVYRGSKDCTGFVVYQKALCKD
jgi:hypothetical protein